MTAFSGGLIFAERENERKHRRAQKRGKKRDKEREKESDVPHFLRSDLNNEEV